MLNNARTLNRDRVIKRLIKGAVIKVLTKIIPVANPDFEEQIDNAKYWLIECESESGIPQREIGLTAQGVAIMKMPNKENYGYWTDNSLRLDDFKQHFNVSEINKESFELHWK